VNLLPRRRTGVPDERERLLLQVCFLPAAEAGRIWDERAARIRLEELPSESHGLLPLLHRRLVELDRRPPSLEWLQGVRRRLWVQNEVRFRSVGAVVDALAAAGVANALLGGAGVLVGHLRRLDLRPLHDVDVLVAADRVDVATGALVGAGWTAARSWRDGFVLDVRAMRFVDGERSVVVRSSTSPPYDDAIDRATRVHLGAGTFDVVERADLLLHTLLDGARTHRRARVRWASDALVVLDGGELDWERLSTAAAARQAGPSVGAALELLHGIVPLRHQPGSLERLASVSRRRWERALGADAAGPTTTLRAHVRRSSGSGLRRTAMEFPAYLLAAPERRSDRVLL
jgi:hypothetical protein